MERKANIETQINAAKKQAREEEIAAHGKLISFRTLISKSKKKYDRKKTKDSNRKNTQITE